MRIESDGHSGNPRLYELIENAPKTGKSPTIWAWPEIIDYFKAAGQPVPGPCRRTRSRGPTYRDRGHPARAGPGVPEPARPASGTPPVPAGRRGRLHPDALSQA